MSPGDTRNSRARGLATALLLSGAVLAGCKFRRASRSADAVRPSPICILQPAVSNETTTSEVALLAGLFPGSPVIPAATAGNSLGLCLEEGRALVVPQAGRLPPGLWNIVLRYIEQGGPVLFWGLHPFEARGAAATDIAPVRPNVALLSPPFRRYDTTAGTILSLEDGSTYRIPTTRMQSPMPRPRSTGGAAGAPDRWVPMLEAREGDQVRGWPASLHVEPATNELVQRWGWLGLELSDATRSAVAAALTQCVARLQTGVYLYQAGCDRFAFAPGAPIEVSARWAGRAPERLPLRLVAELRELDRPVPIGRVLSQTLRPGQSVEINLGRLPAAAPADYIVRLVLEDARGLGRVFDTIDQRIRAIPDRAAAREDWIGISGSRFTFLGRPVHLVGIQYAPISVNGRLPGEYDAHWLEPGAFDPDLVRADLQRLERLGINAISVAYSELSQAPQFRFLVSEARKRGLRTCAQMGCLSPFASDLPKAEQLARAAGLADEPSVFALDGAGRPDLATYAERARLDADWRSWLTEQFGSPRHAENVIGRPLWKRDGEITGPPDAELAQDGPHRVAVAMYRRFIADFTSRHCGRVLRSLRRWGCRQLLTMRSGRVAGSEGGEAALIDPATGAVHLDFVCVNGDGLTGTTNEFNEAGFLTAYARGASEGKPVVWTGFGASVGEHPMRSDLADQARIYRNLLDLVLRSRAAGSFGRWYPGGWNRSGAGDAGIVNPDGTARPAGGVYRDFVNQLRRERDMPPPWRGRAVDPDADARGLPGLWDRWRATYRNETAAGEIQEVRLAGSGQRTGEYAFLCPGGGPLHPPAPIQGLNAEWGRIEVDGVEVDRAPGAAVRVTRGRPITLELINTGPVAWDASTSGPRAVWVALRDRAGNRQLLPVAAARFGERVRVQWAAAGGGTWQARATIPAVAGFGEAIEIAVSMP
jgi:hypothetical protein